MLTVLTIAVVFIAFVLGVVHWKIVRKALLWTSAIISLIVLLASLIAFIVAIVTWEIAPALVGLALLLLFGLLSAIEDWDRNKQFAKWDAYWREQEELRKQENLQKLDD